MTFVDDLLIKMKLLNQILGPTYDGLLLTDRPNRLGDSIEGRHSHGSRRPVFICHIRSKTRTF